MRRCQSQGTLQQGCYLVDPCVHMHIGLVACRTLQLSWQPHENPAAAI